MTDNAFPRDYVALDLETTGFYPDSCGITEIGAVRVRDGRVTDRFQRLVDPGRPIPARVTELTGISDAMVAGLPPIGETLPEFVAWLDGDGDRGGEPIVGHNVSFDIRFLDHASRRVAGGPFVCVDYDTMQISRTLFPEQRRHRLVDLIRRFDIADTEEHRALSDAIQTHQCFEWMGRYVRDSAGLFGGYRFAPQPADDGTAATHERLLRL